MFIPLHDANSLKYIKHQYVTIALILINVLVYIFTALGSDYDAQLAAVGFGYIPSVAFDLAELPAEYVIVPEQLTYLTYAFVHVDIFHLGGNMLFLWVFGDNVEDALGHFRYVVFYMLCAISGALLHGLIVPESQEPLIGASGAIAGIVAAYFILHPRVKVWILAFGRIPLRIPAYITLGLWILFQFAMLLFQTEDQVSWACHAGGIVAGAVLVLLLRRRGTPLLDRKTVTPHAVATDENTTPAPRWGRQ